MRLRVRNSDDGSNGCDIGNRRWSSMNSTYIVGIVWTPTGAPEILMMTVKAMRPWAIPAIGIPTGVVIGSGLGAHGIESQDKAHRQDNAQPSGQVHSLSLRKKFCNQDSLN